MSNDKDKYLPMHVDIGDQVLRNMVEEYLNKDLTQKHSVSHIVKLDDNKWLVRLEYSVVKDHGYAE